MSANTGFLATDRLDFFQLKENLKTYLRGKPEYTDFDFEGSNFSVLLDILSYNTYLNSYYLNQVGSEMWLDSAQLRESVVSHAKELNYVPRSRRSSQATINLTIVPSGNPSSITIPKHFSFQTRIDNTNLTFTTNENIVILPNQGVYSANNVEIYEGEIVTEFFTVVTQDQNIFTLESENIDISSLEVTIIESSTDSTETPYIRAESLFDLDSESEVYFVQGHRANKYQIVFSVNNTLGKRLNPGNIIKVQYRDTIGSEANGAFVFSTKKPLGLNAIGVSTVNEARFGAERESVKEIKFNAPRWFQTQERAVVDSDWENIVRAKFPEIQSVIAYGGELANPPQYGKVIISVKPFGRNVIATPSLKSRIVNELKLKSLTTEPIVVDPEFYYLEIKSRVFYDRDLLTNQLITVRSKVISNILDLNSTTLTGFDKDLRFSRLTSMIDNSDQAIVSNDTSTRIIRRWSPRLNRNENVKFSFGNAIKSLSISTTQQQPLGHAAMFDSSPFFIRDNFNELIECRFQDNGRGIIFVYTISDNNSFIVIRPNVGSINYATGEVNITTEINSFAGQYISLYGRTKEKDIIASQNKFLIIDSSDVSVNMLEAIN